MSKVVISLKIFPSDITIDLTLLKRKIEKSLPEHASVYQFEEEPIAFGLTALIAHIIIPEEKSGELDQIEKDFKRIDEISEIETLMIRKV
ncbi:elongation factor 1-beta [Candidatus Bathyarchaeota archaeon]|jgi:translation elongation factor aEF-1 beta|nr:elongation factor 1-beta [Candidatus Bathyarchaeota archaeon]